MPLSDRVIERIRSSPRTRSGARQLAAMLRQDGRHFHGLSTGEAERVRGHILAAFERCGVPDGALPALREELRTSFSPIVLAGAARALRSLDSLGEELRALLRAAAERIAPRDEYVAFDGSPADAMTAAQEIAATLARKPDRPPCCGGARAAGAAPAAEAFALSPAALERVLVEDQSEMRARLAALLRGRASLVAFFYTRCMNPAKCSLTVSRLASFVRHVRASRADMNVLALSYDGDFDTPARLEAFGRDRAFPFGDDARLGRCNAGWATVRREFGLQVGYGESTVNAHAREAFMVGPGLQAAGIEAETLADPASLARRLAGFASS